LVAGIKIETGELETPGGEKYRGFKITIGGIQGEVERTYEDIEKILKSNEVNFKTHEESTNGKFQSYTVSTS